MGADDCGPFGFDPDLDVNSHQFPSAYRAVDFHDGRFGVFLIHRDTREWWRLVAIFSTWERAERYAGIENDCSESNFKSGADYKTVLPLEPLNESGKEEILPAPDDLPAEPPTGLESPLQTEGPSPYAKLWTRDYSQTLLLSDRICERAGCGYHIPAKRAENRNTKYCSAECGEIAIKERALAKKKPAEDEIEAATPPPPAPANEPNKTETLDDDDQVPATWTDARVEQLRQLVAEGIAYSEIGKRLGITKNAALGKASRLGIGPPGGDQAEIEKFIAERGVTKLPPDPRLTQ